MFSIQVLRLLKIVIARLSYYAVLLDYIVK